MRSRAAGWMWASSSTARGMGSPGVVLTCSMTEFPRAITPEAVNQLPIRRYAGEVVLVGTPEQAERAAADFATERVVGFDTETRPAFRVGQRYPTALAQVAT